MEPTTILLGMAIVFGLYMAWNIGANDVANAMGTSVGSKALTLKQAILVAAVLEFAGAFLVGSSVTETVRKGIVDPMIFADDHLLFAYGMLAAMLAAGTWLLVASYCGWPVSTTHSIVGAIVGFGVVYGGFEAVNWGWDKGVSYIASGWVVSPLLSGLIAYLLFRFLLMRQIFFSDNPVEAAKKWTPYIVFLVGVILAFVMIYKGLKPLGLHKTDPLTAISIAVGIGIVSAIISVFIMRKVKFSDSPVPALEYRYHYLNRSLRKSQKHIKRLRSSHDPEITAKADAMLAELDEVTNKLQTSEVGKTSSQFHEVEKIFSALQILSACFVAFAHGANDVANAIGPMSAAIAVLGEGGREMFETGKVHGVPMWVLAMGGVGIVLGLATWGWRVIKTVGEKITELTPSRGFAAELSAAITIVFASKLGLPVSTTHCLVGAVLGVGMARGLGALNAKVVRNIVVSWAVTLPAGAVLAVIFYLILKAIFGAG